MSRSSFPNVLLTGTHYFALEGEISRVQNLTYANATFVIAVFYVNDIGLRYRGSLKAISHPRFYVILCYTGSRYKESQFYVDEAKAVNQDAQA